MTHETDMQRVTNELRRCAHKRIVRQEWLDKWQLKLFWITVGGIVGTIFGLAARLR